MERPEHQLLLACARACTGLERKDLITACLKIPIDWEYLLETARAHMMTSQLYRHLDANCRDAIPQAILERLNNHYLNSSRSNLYYTAELIKILELFNINDIPAIPFKGPALALTYYEDPALREFGDLDILIEQKNVFRALKLLRRMNYPEIPDYPPDVKSRILEYKNHYLVKKASLQLIVELHWRLLPAHYILPISTGIWWKRAESSFFEGRSILGLSAEDLLAVLCIHGCKHIWRSLAWLVDIARLFEHQRELDWDYLFREYSHPDLKRMIFLSLITVNDLLSAGPPEEILRTARRDSVAAKLARESQTRIFLHRGKREPVRFLRFQIRTKSSWADRVRFCYRIVSAPVMIGPDVILPRFLTPLHNFAGRIRNLRFPEDR